MWGAVPSEACEGQQVGQHLAHVLGPLGGPYHRRETEVDIFRDSRDMCRGFDALLLCSACSKG